MIFCLQAGDKHWGTDESAFNLVLCTRSFPQLRATFEAYHGIAGKGIVDSITNETSGSLQEGFLAIGKHSCVLNLGFYLNRGLHVLTISILCENIKIS